MNYSSLGVKVAVLLGLVLALLLPTRLIVNLVQEREAAQKQVGNLVSQGSSGAQRLIGPVLVVPYQMPVEGGGYRNGTLYILPEALKADANVKVTPRKVGIYQTQTYRSEVAVSGQFTVPALAADGMVIGTPYLSVGVSDVRGLRTQGPLTLGGSTFAFQSNSRVAAMPQGIHAPFTLSSYQQPQKLDFNFRLGLMGTASLAFTPLGDNSAFTLAGDWPHPNFSGDLLPAARRIDRAGFAANWDSASTANGVHELALQGLDQGDAAALNKLPAFSTGLIEPVNQYQLNLRLAKYAILFIGLTFLTFFMFEVLKSLRVHPVQYALVGMALVLFYLSLLALSEHVGFDLAYLIASSGCVLQIMFYSRYVLGNLWRALGLGVLLATLYAVLWAVLQAEDFALLMGSGLLFFALTLVMTLTRRLDWYRLGERAVDEA